jgi:CRISPR-associated protein Cas8a1/Cst1, subtype I-B/TNEAP
LADVEVKLNDFLFNAGVVGFCKVLDYANKPFKKTGNKVIFDEEVIVDFEKDYINAMIDEFKEDTVWNEIIQEGKNIKHLNLEVDEEQKILIDFFKKINEKLDRASYKSGVEIIKNYGDDFEVYEIFKKAKEEKNLDTKKDYIEQVLEYVKKYKEVFCMKDIIYTKIDKFWQNVSFLNSQKNKEDIGQEYRTTFVEPAIKYIETDKKGNLCCISCGSKITKTIGKSMAWIKDVGVDFNRKTSMFWNFNPDIFICPICSVIYSCVPLGFSMIGQDGIFINSNENIDFLIDVNNTEKARTYIIEKDSSKSSIDSISNNIFYKLLKLSEQEDNVLKVKNEIENIQVIRRKVIDRDNQKYIFNLISKDKLNVFRNTESNFESLINIVFKTNEGYLNIYEEVLHNFLENKKQYNLLNKILYSGLKDNKSISFIYHILIINLNCIGGRSVEEVKKEINYMMRSGNALRNYFNTNGGENVDNKLRAYTYHLINALNVNNVSEFMKIVTRMYNGLGQDIPNAYGFSKMLNNEDDFQTLGYAYILGLKQSKRVENEENKKEENKDE